jgi:hypothetical protein
MNRSTKIIPLLVLLSALTVMSSGRFRSSSSSQEAAGAQKRMRFQIVAIEESGAKRELIAKATIDGPPGTDFSVDLQSRRFKMNARFLTDLVSPGELKVRAKLNTRRLYGYSQNNLPLYEEDTQSQTLNLGLDEQVILLPFGKGGGGELLKIEVTPSITDRPVLLTSGEMQAPVIDISEPGPGGVIAIHALKIPHNFDVEAVLLEDGREVARGVARSLIEEPQEIALAPREHASSDVIANPVVVNMTIKSYELSRPVDRAGVSFDVYRIKTEDGFQREPLAQSWTGVAELGSAIDYALAGRYLTSSGKKYELRFRVRLVHGSEPNN